MKTIDMNGVSYIDAVRNSGCRWYWGNEYGDGDLYEKEEIYNAKGFLEKTELYLIRYPEGIIYHPIAGKRNQAMGEPVYIDGKIYLLMVDFGMESIHIFSFDTASKATEKVAEIDLNTIDDCYNLRLHGTSLTLCRQSYDEVIDVVWPERKSFSIETRESFISRDQDRLYFSKWYEDPEYREEVIIRSLNSGEITERFSGSIISMPDGDLWHLV